MKRLKLFFALFAMLALGVGNAWAEEVEMSTFSAISADMDTYISYTTAKGGGTSNPAVNSNQIRLYQGTPGGNITISAKDGVTITEVTIGSGMATQIRWEINGTTDASNTSLAKNAKTTKSGISTKSITCHCYGTTSSSRLYVNYLKVVYSIESGETPGEGGGEEPTPDPEEPETGGETWTLVTNASDLKAGDQIVIAATGSDNALGPQASNNRTAVAITKTGNNITWTTDVQIITLEAGNKANTFAFNTGSGYLYAASSSSNYLRTKTNLDDDGSWAITITSEGVATIKAQGSSTRNWIRHNSSSAIFSCYGSGQNDVAIYKKVTSSGGDEPSTPTPSVTLNPTEKDFGTVNVGETPSQEFTITTENTTAALTASIDNTTDYAVSAITGDKVTVTYQPQSAGTHSAVLTVKAGEEATATVNLTGKAVEALEGTWILVTDASSLKAGDEIIIAAKESDVALSTTQASNNRPEVAITKNDNTITATSETQVLTLQAGKTEGTLALYTGAGYLFAASSGSNWLRTETELSDNSSWSVAVAADGTATMIAQGENTRNTLYYNKNNKIFSCYSNAQQPIALYKNTNGQQLAGLAYTTTKYLTKLGDAFAAPALTNPNSLAVTYSSSDNNVATVAADGAVTIKAAGVVKITASFAGNSSFLEGSASYTIGVTEHAGTQADPYSVADARRVIDAMEIAEGVYATGIVSEIVTAYNSTYGNISYNISADGLTTSDQLQAYRGKSYDGANFTSADDVKVGDEVVIKGTLKKYSTTYEFDENNQLVSLNRTKEQAGLAYAETEHTANVGEEFAEPALTNPNNLTVTYSSSNTTLATVNATTGEVSILAAGKVTITASSAADATYAAGSASYNITISDPSLAVAQLPFTYNSGKADIETTAGITQEGLGSDYTSAGSPKLKFDHTGDNIVICFGSQADELSYDIKGNPSQGTFSCTFAVQESEDGSTYTDLVTYTTLETTTTNKTHKLAPASRYVKFVFTEKSNGNVALGNISITKPDLRAEAGIAWNPATVSLTVGDAFTAPTFNNPNGLSGITFASSNEALATVNNAGVISLVNGKTGTATITATYAGNETYKAAEVTCVITVSPKSEKVVILAQLEGQWYAMTGAYVTDKTNVLAAIPVEYINGKLYNVAETDKASIEWQRSMNGNKATFKNGDNYLTGGTSGTDLTLKTIEFEWDYNGVNYLSGNETTKRTFLYCENTKNNVYGFKNFAISNAGSVKNNSDGTTESYSSTPEVVAPVYATATIYTREDLTVDNHGTICLPYGSSNYSGAEFYEVSSLEVGKGLWLDQLAAGASLEAGKPYIFKATAAKIAVAYEGAKQESPVAGVNGLTGTFTDIEANDVLVGNYIIAENQIWVAGEGATLPANRAYINATLVPKKVQPEIPGRRRVCMGENAATGFDNIVAPEGQAVKVIENGQLIIIRDGVKYNVQGQKL